jgi:hypothetical protein
MKTVNLNGWEKLICPFFAPVCRRVLSDYLEENGFAETGLNEIGGVLFSRFGIFLEISYELESAPNYWLSVVIGTGDRKYDAAGHPCCIPYWYLLPRDRPEHRGQSIKFKNESDLEALLLRFKGEFFESYAKPLWLNLDRLEKAVANFRSEFST